MMAQLDLHFMVAENDPGSIFADSTSNGLKDPVVIGVCENIEATTRSDKDSVP